MASECCPSVGSAKKLSKQLTLVILSETSRSPERSEGEVPIALALKQGR